MTSEKGEPMACASDLDLFIDYAYGRWVLREHPAMSYIEVQLGPAEIEGFRAELASLRARLDAMEGLCCEARQMLKNPREEDEADWLARFDALDAEKKP